MSEKAKPSKKDQLSEDLIDAAKVHDLITVQDLIKKGADVNYVRYTDSDCWYGGNTHTALYEAVHSEFKDGEYGKYVEVIRYLL